ANSAADRGLRERQRTRPRCPFDSRGGGGKNLPPSGSGKYFLYKRRGRFSRFGAGELPASQPKIKPNQVNAGWDAALRRSRLSWKSISAPRKSRARSTQQSAAAP